MSEFKIGDLVEFVWHNNYYSKGDRFRVSDLWQYGVVDDDGIVICKDSIRLVEETEAEKRKVKFGDIGSLKGGEMEFTFLSDALEKNGFGEVLWSVCYEDGRICHYHPSNIRLDHEPEYKEIPFCEATHEQRMKKGCVDWLGHTVDEIVRFKNGTYAWSFSGSSAVMVQTDHLTVRIPA